MQKNSCCPLGRFYTQVPIVFSCSRSTAFQLAPPGIVTQQEEAAPVTDGTLWTAQRLLQWQDLHPLQGQAPSYPLQEPHVH